MEIRPIWQMKKTLTFAEPEPKDLLDLESSISKTLDDYVDVIRSFAICSDEDVKQATSLLESASVDLVAGCEMARCGYIKQAYALWRSWYEQSIFALYFLEAPVHRHAWKVSDSVSLGDSPRYKLMLHQLLSESGERHPFAIMYAERSAAMLSFLKATIKREDEIVKRANKVLTLLSQGVHGTFRPKKIESFERTCATLKEHGVPALSAAWSVTSQLWLLFIASSIDLPPDAWTKMRNSGLTKEAVDEYFSEGGSSFVKLNQPFKAVFGEKK